MLFEDIFETLGLSSALISMDKWLKWKTSFTCMWHFLARKAWFCWFKLKDSIHFRPGSNKQRDREEIFFSILQCIFWRIPKHLQMIGHHTEGISLYLLPVFYHEMSSCLLIQFLGQRFQLLIWESVSACMLGSEVSVNRKGRTLHCNWYPIWCRGVSRNFWGVHKHFVRRKSALASPWHPLTVRGPICAKIKGVLLFVHVKVPTPPPP